MVIKLLLKKQLISTKWIYKAKYKIDGTIQKKSETSCIEV